MTQATSLNINRTHIVILLSTVPTGPHGRLPRLAVDPDFTGLPSTMTLPLELIDKICWQLEDNDDALNSCALLSRFWNISSRRYSSFRDLLLTKSNHDTLFTLLASPHSTCRVTLRSIQFDDELRGPPPSSYWIFPCLPRILQTYRCDSIHTLSFHHCDWRQLQVPAAHLLPQGLTIHTLILDDCDFADMPSIFDMTSSNAIDHVSLNHLGIKNTPAPFVVDSYLPFKQLTMTSSTSQDCSLLGVLILQKPFISNLTHLTLLGPPVWLPWALTHALSLQSLTFTSGLFSLPSSSIDLENHTSFSSLQIFASRVSETPFNDVLTALQVFFFPPSLSSLTLNLPAHRLALPDCWSALPADLPLVPGLTCLNINIITHHHIYRPFNEDCPVGASMPRAIDPSTLGLALTTWRQKTIDAFPQWHDRGVLKLGVYEPSLDDKLNTLYRVL